MKRRIPLAPAEGWLTLGLVLLMCLTLAWSLDDARWVLGRDEYLDFLRAAPRSAASWSGSSARRSAGAAG